MKCEICGAEHELLDPTFKRPEDVFSMSLRGRMPKGGYGASRGRMAGDHALEGRT